MPRGAASSPYVKHGEQPEWNTRSTSSSAATPSSTACTAALRTGTIIEQAKGILTERHGITADQAFAELRNRARNTNNTLVDIAQTVTLSYPLFKTRPIDTK